MITRIVCRDSECKRIHEVEVVDLKIRLKLSGSSNIRGTMRIDGISGRVSVSLTESQMLTLSDEICRLLDSGIRLGKTN